MKKFLIWTGIICSAIIIFFIAVYFFILSFFNTEPMVASNSFIQMRISGSLPEYSAPDPFGDYFRGITLDLQKIQKTFNMAAVDDRVKGIVLEIGMITAGFAKIKELQQQIFKFRESGKKVLACLRLGMTRDYYLATACDSIYLLPGGALLLSGLGAEVTFYKGLLNKLGIDADFEHVGLYKNAPDMYTRQTMTNAQREVINEILDIRFNEIIRTIAANRKLAEDTVRYMINTVSGFNPERALTAKLIDAVKYPSELASLLEQDTKFTPISAAAYANINPSSVGLGRGSRIAVVNCSGTITGGLDGSDPIFGLTSGSGSLIRNLDQAAKSKAIKAIILRIDSPGGSSIASDEIWHAVAEAQKRKPVLASISDIGASGGYFIALAADRIIAHEMSLVGSIGVYAGKFSLRRLYEKLEVNTVAIHRGENAGLLSLNNTFTDSERRVIKNMILDFYQHFIEKVCTSRNIPLENIYEIAQGRVWSGKQALDLKLIDTLGGWEETINLVKKMADLEEEEEVRLVYYPKRKSLLGQILRNISWAKINKLNPVKYMESYLQKFHNQPLALMPYILEFK
jgi:protease-4